jgi:hypothetical protein
MPFVPATANSAASQPAEQTQQGIALPSPPESTSIGGDRMKKIQQLTSLSLATLALVVSSGLAVADGASDDDANFCMNIEIEPFHMMPGYMTDEGACAVRDYLDGELQEAFYPFTIEDHKFNCEVFGDTVQMPFGEVPSSVKSQDSIVGTIDGHPFEADLYCASQTNWYQDYCVDPTDPNLPCFQLAQPFFNLIDRDPYPRVTEVSVFDGAITVGNNKIIPIVMATRAGGIMHVEIQDETVGASITHSLLGLAILKGKDELKVLEGSADMLLQGHIFSPVPVLDDPGAARIRGAICSKALYEELNRQGGKKGKKGRDDD